MPHDMAATNSERVVHLQRLQAVERADCLVLQAALGALPQPVAARDRKQPGQAVGDFYTSSYAWFNAWQADTTEKFAAEPTGDAVALSKAMLAKYAPLIEAAG